MPFSWVCFHVCWTILFVYLFNNLLIFFLTECLPSGICKMSRLQNHLCLCINANSTFYRSHPSPSSSSIVFLIHLYLPELLSLKPPLFSLHSSFCAWSSWIIFAIYLFCFYACWFWSRESNSGPRAVPWAASPPRLAGSASPLLMPCWILLSSHNLHFISTSGRDSGFRSFRIPFAQHHYFLLI